MKCEICHKRDAETALATAEGDEDNELYVCLECAKAERLKHQKKSQRTRKIVEINGQVVDGDEVPPFIGAIMGAFDDMVNEIEKASGGESGENGEEAKSDEPKVERAKSRLEFPLGRVSAEYRIGSMLHLEGLHLIGELEAVKRSMRALDVELTGIEADGIRDTGHVYSFAYSGSTERAKRIVEDILREERNARVRLFEEMPRIFGDALCRALAIMKNCRLLSPGEFFDLLSPLRFAAKEKMLDGITFKEIEKLLTSVDLTSQEDKLTPEERDRVDAERADQMNRRFEDVVLNERAEGNLS